MSMEQATPYEIEVCIDEAREENPEATEDELWKIGARIYEEAKRNEITF